MKKLCYILLLLPLFAFGQDNIFNPNPGNNWSDINNWSLGHVPTATEDVIINSGYCLIPPNTGTYYAKTVLVMPGATLNVNNNSTLIINNTDDTLNGYGMRIRIGAIAYIHGTLDISDVNGLGADGLVNDGELRIYGNVLIQDCPDNGFSNRSGSVLEITESGNVNIIYCDGGMSFNNVGSASNAGTITVDQMGYPNGNHDMYIYNSHLQNTGTITTAGGSGASLVLFGDGRNLLSNEICSVIDINGVVLDIGTSKMTNNGYFYQRQGVISSVDTVINHGFIQVAREAEDFVNHHLEGGGYILGDIPGTIHAGQPVQPALLGGGYTVTVVGNQFYTDATLTEPAGYFDPNTNTWTPNSNAVELDEFFLRVQTDNSCLAQVMSFTLDNIIEENTATANFCEFFNSKPINESVDGNACVDGIINVSEAFQLTPQMTPPTNPPLGYLYLDGNTRKLRYWNGNNWKTIE